MTVGAWPATLGVVPHIEYDHGATTRLLAICRHYGVRPEQAWMVGDTRNDLLAARAAGFGVAVGVRTGVASDTELMGSPIPAASVDVMLDTAANILQFIDACPATATAAGAGP